MVGLAALLVLGFADSAWAWGPAMHVGFADTVLGNLGLLPAAIAAILGRHRAAYRYGSIAADVVFAKRLSRVKQFCHHWSTAFRLLEEAPDERAKAFAYGYLSHLAADTIAHGKFVPRQVLVSGSSLNVGHLYWELRADAVQSEKTWRRLQRLLDDEHGDHRSRLAPHLRDTFLPHQWNLVLFDRMNTVSVSPAVRRTFGLWSRTLGSELPASLLAAYGSESVDRILSVLSDGAKSAVIRDDPNGTSALMQVNIRRREARRLRRSGVRGDRRSVEIPLGFRPTITIPTVGQAHG